MNEPPPPSFPAATGSRLQWDEVAEPVRIALDERLGATVVEARSQSGGFSPGAAARLRLSDGSRVFAKAAGPEPNPDAPSVHRREARVAAALPVGVPAPRLLFALEIAQWVILVFEDVEGRHPMLPWREGELRHVLDAIGELAATLTPSPLELPLLAEDAYSGFGELLTLREGGDTLRDVDGWIVRNLDRLAALEARWADAAAGETLLHTDIRADNVLLTDDRLYVVDWPHASIGARWADLLFMLPSVAMQGGPAPWALFDGHPVGAGADPEAVTAVLCGLAGFFVGDGRQPPPPGLPTLRAFQAAQGAEAVRWLRHRTGWP